MNNEKIFETEFGGKKLTISTGRFCEQANGSCMVRCGETIVMVNATMADKPRDGIDFFPLGVDFEEKMYSVGKIPGGFKKREGRPSDKAILTSRLIDRPLRPLFPKGFFNDVTIVATALSVDPDVAPEPLAMIGSSVALTISDIPFQGPTGAVNVAYIDGQYIINPNSKQREQSLMQLTVAGTQDAVLMVEAGAKEVTEEEMLNAIMFAHEEIKKLVKFQLEIKEAIGKPLSEKYEIKQVEEELANDVIAYSTDLMKKTFSEYDRQARQALEEEMEEEIFAHFAEKYPDKMRVSVLL